MVLKEKIFLAKVLSLKCASKGIHFLVKLQAAGLALLSGIALSLILMFVFGSVAINVVTVAGLVYSAIA